MLTACAIQIHVALAFLRVGLTTVQPECTHQPHPPVNQVTKQLAMSIGWSVLLLALLGLGNCTINAQILVL